MKKIVIGTMALLLLATTLTPAKQLQNVQQTVLTKRIENAVHTSANFNPLRVQFAGLELVLDEKTANNSFYYKWVQKTSLWQELKWGLKRGLWEAPLKNFILLSVNPVTELLDVTAKERYEQTRQECLRQRVFYQQHSAQGRLFCVGTESGKVFASLYVGTEDEHGFTEKLEIRKFGNNQDIDFFFYTAESGANTPASVEQFWIPEMVKFQFPAVKSAR